MIARRLRCGRRDFVRLRVRVGVRVVVRVVVLAAPAEQRRDDGVHLLRLLHHLLLVASERNEVLLRGRQGQKAAAQDEGAEHFIPLFHIHTNDPIMAIVSLVCFARTLLIYYGSYWYRAPL